MKEIGTLGALELKLLLKRLPICLRFASPSGSKPSIRKAVDNFVEHASKLESSLAYAEWTEHIANIDQTPSDFEHALRQREAANHERSMVSKELLSLLRSLGSEEAISVVKASILSEISAIRERRRGTNSNPIARIAEFQTAIVVSDGGLPLRRIEQVYAPIYELLARSVNDHEFLYHFSRHHRAFEIFIADCYKLAGWEQVELTPQRGDGGRDIIATRSDIGKIRILEQTKAYSPGTLVTHDDVRSMIGVLGIDHNASKGIITTTSDFQPTVMSNPEFTQFMPFRLELRNGETLRNWLSEIRGNPASRPTRQKPSSVDK